MTMLGFTIKSLFPNAPPAPYICAYISRNIPNLDSWDVPVRFRIDTGADRTRISLYRALQVVGREDWDAICPRLMSFSTTLADSRQVENRELPVRLSFFHHETRQIMWRCEGTILIPEYSIEQEELENRMVREKDEPIAFLGCDFLESMSFEFNPRSVRPVTLRARNPGEDTAIGGSI